jgi:diaminohydroxyphosphoribosylaminopyrimidine deaminase/5-amino-6-(5-phosphoribosylamino)uracil reductase
VRFEHGLMEEEARELNIGFVSRVTRGRPWVRLKDRGDARRAHGIAGRHLAVDHRRAARRDGPSLARARLRGATGAGTVRADDPRLTVREVKTSRQPLRVIVDSRLETPPTARVLQGEKALVFAATHGALPNAEVVCLPNKNQKVELAAMLEELAKARRQRAARRRPASA